MANKRVKIEVTNEDMKEARLKCVTGNMGGWSRQCVIATAVRRYVPSLRACNFDSLFAGLEREPFATIPKRAQTAIRRFDRNDTVQPFSFYITVPEELLHV